MKAHKFLLLLLAFVLIGQGCVGSESSTDTVSEEDSAEVEVMEEDEMEEGEEVMEEDEEEEDEEAMEEDEDAQADVTFEVSGTNFAFSETELTVNQGDTVRIVFTSDEGFHDWVVDEFDAATEQIKEGNTSEVTFVASEAGEFEYYCSVGEHRAKGMVGTLIVE